MIKLYNYAEFYIMILIDLSQLCLSGSFAFSSQLKNTNENKDAAKDILRHIILSQIKHYKKKYGIDYGDIVISCDSRNYWRKAIFPQYKITRKKTREESDLDWKLIFETINEVVDDLKQYFPYRIVRVDGAESDDIIAVITKKIHTENPNEKILIVSSDQDFIQLHKYCKVEQVSPRTKKMIVSDDPVKYLKEKVIRGDRSDCIPNIFSDDNVFVDGTKQLPVTKKKIDEWINYDTNPPSNDEQSLNRLINRNRVLIDFEYIPQDIQTKILNEYNAPILGNKAKVFNYLIEHRCAVLVKDINNF